MFRIHTSLEISRSYSSQLQATNGKLRILIAAAAASSSSF
jgi:hypothetical protein